MNKRTKITSIFLCITLQFGFFGNVIAQETVLDSPIYDSVLLQSGRLNAALSGLSEIDYSAVKNELLLMQSDINHHPKQQQAQFWYYLAVCGWKLSLPSEHVLPHIDKALSFRDSVADYTLFKMLMQSKDIARDYQNFAKVIDYINEIKQLVGENPDPQRADVVSPVDALYGIAHHQIGEHAKAVGYLNRLILLTEKTGDKPVRYWFQVLASAQKSNGDLLDAINTVRKQLTYFPHSNTQTYLEFLEQTFAQNTLKAGD